MSPLREFYFHLFTIKYGYYEYDHKRIKSLIGDSTKNHRLLSVNQLLRYLMLTRRFKLAVNLEEVYRILKPYIKKNRNKRTDAIDITELFNAYETLVLDSPKLLKKVNNILAPTKE